MQIVKAYYDKGAFVPFEPITVPKGSHAIVTILDVEIHHLQDIETHTQDDDDFTTWHMRIKEALELSADEELPEIFFQRSTDMRSPLDFDA